MIRKESLSIVFTIIGCVGTIATAVMAAYETPEARRVIEEHRKSIDPSGETDISTKEKVVDYAKSYWRTEACAAVTIAADIASCMAGRKAYKTLLGYSATAAAIGAKYKDKAIEAIGKEKEKFLNSQVRDEVKSDEFSTKKVWFYEPASGQLFQSTWSDIYRNEYDATMQLYAAYYEGNASNGEVELGDVYPQLRKLAPKTAKWVWDVDRTIHRYGYPWIDFYHERKNGKASEDGDEIDWNLNDGRETYVINYGAWPEPPELFD
jgi:hypothetical protein